MTSTNTALTANDQMLVAAFRDLCSALCRFKRIEGLDPGLLHTLEQEALRLVRAHPGVLRDCGAQAAAQSGSRELFLALDYTRAVIERDTMRSVMTWLTPKDVPALLERTWVLGIGPGALTHLLSGQQDLQQAFLQGLESQNIVMCPDQPHAIVDQEAFLVGACEADVAFAAALIRLMVARHPDDASSDLEIESRTISKDRLTALILAGARLTPGAAAYVSDDSPARNAHSSMKIFSKHGSLENFLATTSPF